MRTIKFHYYTMQIIHVIFMFVIYFAFRAYAEANNLEPIVDYGLRFFAVVGGMYLILYLRFFYQLLLLDE